MSNLPQKTIEALKKYLLRQQQQVESNLKTVEAADPAKEVLPESSEPGTDSWIAEEHSSSLAIGSSLKTTANNVKKALGRIKAGTYGKCENCGKTIETGRLLAMPTATLCLSCSQKSAK